MSTFKKVISIVLCFSLLAGSFAFLGDLIVPKAAAADEYPVGTSSIKSYAELNAAHDNFVYVGVDVYEITPNEDGTITNHGLTDGYVKAGQWLEYREYIKSDMWVGNFDTAYLYDKRFFDVRVVSNTTASTSTTFVKADYEAGVKMTTLVNAEHPMQAARVPTNALTACPCINLTAYTSGYCLIDEATYTNLDQVKQTVTFDGTVSSDALDMREDLWFVNWYVKVLDAPTITEATSYSPDSIWKNTPHPTQTTMGDSRVIANVGTGDIITGEETDIVDRTKCVNMNMPAKFSTVTLLNDDTYTTFKLGDPPVSYTATFMANGSEFDKVSAYSEAEYSAPTGTPTKEGYSFKGWALSETATAADAVTFPQKMGTENVTYYAIFEADVVEYEYKLLASDGSVVAEGKGQNGATITFPENVYGYIDAAGKVVKASSYTMPEGGVEITVILTTDKFPVTLNLNNGSYAEGTVLPEGATLSADGKSLTLNAAMGETVDLSTISLPKRTGWTGEWYPATVTISATTGASATIRWTQSNYTASFYASEEAYKNGEDAIKTATVTYGQQAQYGDASALRPSEKEKFAGWADADTGVVVSTGAIIYNYETNKAFYPTWTPYESSITLMVRDYENGSGWTELQTTYADPGAKLGEAYAEGLDVDAIMGWDFDVTVNTIASTHYADVEDAAAGSLAEITYPEANTESDEVSNKVYYLCNTKATYEITWRMPKFDDAGLKTDDYITEVVTAEVPYNNTNPDGYKIYKTVPETINTTVPTGYKFNGWVDAEGNAVTYYANKGVLISAAEDGMILTADVSLVEYNIVFNVNNSDGSYATRKTLEGTYTIGETVTIDGLKFYDEEGNETVLPTIGKDNSEQTGGNLTTGNGYTNKEGYTFTGWTLGKGANAEEFALTDTIELTAENIKKYVTTGTVNFEIYGVWEAGTYDLIFYYATGFDEDGNATYEELVRYSLKTGDSLTSSRDAAKVLVNEKLPEGKTFVTWSDAAVTKMPGKDFEVYPTYVNTRLDLYIDYNHSTEDAPLTLKETMSKNSFYYLYYGLDIMETPEDELNGLYDSIRKMSIASRPGENYICIGWDVYAVEDGKDVYDTNNWIPVDTDVDSYTATTRLVFQAQWKAYGDFFFRLYDTNHKMVMALGKDFKMYYWASEIACDRSEADGVNHLPDDLVILLFIPTLEGWDWSGFFDIDMWKGLSLAIEPFALNKTFFDPKNFASLMELLMTFLLGELGIEVGGDDSAAAE